MEHGLDLFLNYIRVCKSRLKLIPEQRPSLGSWGIGLKVLGLVVELKVWGLRFEYFAAVGFRV